MSNRSVTDVARESQVGWHTAHQALIVAAAGWLPAAGAGAGAGHR